MIIIRIKIDSKTIKNYQVIDLNNSYYKIVINYLNKDKKILIASHAEKEEIVTKLNEIEINQIKKLLLQEKKLLITKIYESAYLKVEKHLITILIPINIFLIILNPLNIIYYILYSMIIVFFSTNIISVVIALDKDKYYKKYELYYNYLKENNSIEVNSIDNVRIKELKRLKEELLESKTILKEKEKGKVLIKKKTT